MDSVPGPIFQCPFPHCAIKSKFYAAHFPNQGLGIPVFLLYRDDGINMYISLLTVFGCSPGPCHVPQWSLQTRGNTAWEVGIRGCPVANVSITPSFLGLVSKSSPKKPRGRNIFKALFCCFRAQHVGQSTSSTELSPYKEEANTIAKVAGSKVVWCQQGCDCHGRERVTVTIAGGQASLACVRRSLAQRRPFLCPFHGGPSSSC